jgi:hypothetical protein
MGVAVAEARFMLVWGGAATVKLTLDLLSASSPPVVVSGRGGGRAGGLGAFKLCSVLASAALQRSSPARRYCSSYSWLMCRLL